VIGKEGFAGCGASAQPMSESIMNDAIVQARMGVCYRVVARLP